MGIRDFFANGNAPDLWEECPLCIGLDDECEMCEGLGYVPHWHDEDEIEQSFGT